MAQKRTVNTDSVNDKITGTLIENNPAILKCANRKAILNTLVSTMADIAKNKWRIRNSETLLKYILLPK